MSIRPFHLAFPVKNVQKQLEFYKTFFNAEEGRSDTKWIDFNFYGHQVVFHEVDMQEDATAANPVDGHNVPVPHFGVILEWKDWEILSEKLQKAGINFIIEPYIRFKGLAGEQATMFFKDPNGLSIEMKAFKNDNQIFAK